NRLEGNTVRGIIIRGGNKLATVDSNVVADDTSFAVQLHRVTTLTRNLITRNTAGIWLTDYAAGSTIAGNRIEGNVVDGLRNETGQSVTAQSNWWNSVSGPTCGAGSITGCSTGGGDVVNANYGTVDISNFLTAPP